MDGRTKVAAGLAAALLALGGAACGDDDGADIRDIGGTTTNGTGTGTTGVTTGTETESGTETDGMTTTG